MIDDSRILRDRRADAGAWLDRPDPADDDGASALLVQTRAVASYPTAAGSYFACAPAQVEGPEVEGAAATFVIDPVRSFLAFNVGSRVPPPGTTLIVHSCGGRWTFRYDG